jgi:hypothetical protein
MNRAKSGKAKDLLITRVGSCVWVGIADGGHVKLMPDEARSFISSLELVTAEAEFEFPKERPDA